MNMATDVEKAKIPPATESREPMQAVAKKGWPKGWGGLGAECQWQGRARK